MSSNFRLVVSSVVGLVAVMAIGPAAFAQEGSCSESETYLQGLEAYTDGDYARAAAAFEKVAAACPGYGKTATLLPESRKRLAEAGAPSDQGGAGSDQAAAAPAEGAEAGDGTGDGATEDAEATQPAAKGEREPVSGFGRFELIAGQGLVGLFQGGLFCVSVLQANCSIQGGAGSSLLGGLLYSGVAILATMGGVSEGQAAVIGAGSIWGTYLGWMTWIATVSTVTGESIMLASGLGNALGLGAGIALALTVRPRAGQGALAASGMQWGALLGFAWWVGLSSTGAVAFDIQDFGTSQIVGAVAGLGIAIAANFFYSPMRSRIRLADLGTLLAGGIGAAAALVTSAGTNYGMHFAVWESILLPAGFVGSLLITHALDIPPDVGERVALLPTAGGAPGASLVVAF